MFKKALFGDTPAIRCSFCCKSQDDVRMMIAGPSVNICDECVEVCAEILRGDAQRAAPHHVDDGSIAKDAPQLGISAPAVRCALCRMPTPIEDAVLIPNRGVLCPGCLGEIEATVAERGHS